MTLAPFAIGKYEVTNSEYLVFLNHVKKRGTVEDSWLKTGAEGSSCRILSESGKFNVKAGSEQYPVACVSWYGAIAYADWLSQQTGDNYRLPTEAEWEYAARAGTETKWSYGNDEKELDGYAWYDANSNVETHPVGQKKANPWGLYDVHGNVREWVNDWYGEYAAEPQENPHGPETGDFRVIRGGGWFISSANIRSADRNLDDPAIRYVVLGFRLARTL